MDDDLITELRSVACPQVFGYLRHVTGGPARHSALVGCLTEYCRQHELTLCGVFTDREATVAVRSPAFVGLLDALELPDTYGAVVPALSHLGPKLVVSERQRQIAATGTRLIVVRPIRPTTERAPLFGVSSGLQHQGDT
ncbi:hypothetical protein [Streptomyces lancefieldiae]|uniref:Uncharacterized protein n=1 Tax=Streptomyces lancefieldiae TaxID=3075520 RepID=A0ABU3ATL9_9ACTN|nr:hypothetical protein [Streptomyces sp. DSM 40712]MDT0613510.1 hypothetical protein [Streptomyces sp. DSM 40712]